MVGFQFLVITSLFSENLMFSVTCTFSHCDLALVVRKQWFFLNFSCLWRMSLLEHSAHLWLKEKNVWLPYWRAAPCRVLSVISVQAPLYCFRANPDRGGSL